MSLKGTVFDVERFATKDGPGIRSVVFMKGCNMRCPWCHNPEGLRFGPELLYDPTKCIGCGLCAGVCVCGARIAAQGPDRALCKSCLKCAAACCSGALQTVGKTYSVDELVNVLVQDLPYYRYSGGGVTISGGEPLCQSEFVAGLLEALRAADVHTALETNLSLEWRMAERVLRYTQLLMFDIKHMDSQQHRRLTGVALESVLENARRAACLGIPAIVRTPVITGVNDSAEVIGAIAEWIAQTFGRQLRFYELLTYHPIGVDKAVKLGLRERSHPLPVPGRETMNALACAAAQAGVPVWLDGSPWKE